jgi:hypothetical protein
MKMSKKLEDVIGYSNLNPSGKLDCPIDLSTLTQYNKEPSISGNYNVVSASWINFAGLFSDYQLQDLIGFGFDSTCCTCNNHYAIVFTNLTEHSFVTDGNDIVLMIGINAISGISTSTAFCQYIYNVINTYPHFSDHFTGYGYKDSVFWIYDHRNDKVPDPDYDFGLFYSSTYKIAIKMTAEYIGLPVMENTNYDIADVKVIVEYSNGDIEELQDGDYNVSSTLVTKSNTTFTATYKHLSDTFNVQCLYVIGFSVSYNGPHIYLYDNYDLNDVQVVLQYNLSEYDKILTPQEYAVTNQTITRIAANYFTATEKITGTRYSARFCVIGVRVILDIRVRYVGPPVAVSDSVDPDNIVVEIDTVDENGENFITVLLKYGDDILVEEGIEFTDEYLLLAPKLLITNVGDNVRTVVYKDADIDWQGEITIPGIPKVINFETRYTGDMRIIGSVVSKEQVYAEVTKLINYYTHEIVIEEVPPAEWAFYDVPIISEENKGILKTKHQDGLFSHVTVPFFDPETLRLRCWYESVKIEIGNQFNQHHVIVYMIDENGIVLRVDNQDIEFIDETVIHEEGWNFYRLRLKNPKFSHIIGTYAVPGYKPLDLAESLVFKAVYIDARNNFREIDYTKHFTRHLAYEDVFYVGWDSVLNAINELGLYGTYILTVPKESGLSNKYDQDWEVLCIDKHAVQANILKTYKEENETWQQRKQLQQTLKKWWQVPNQS